MTATGQPVEMYWKNGALHPTTPFWAKRAQKEFVEGEVYSVIDQQEPSTATRNHYFAVIKRAWESLPEAIADDYQTPEVLRKKALIRCGYHDEQTFVCSSQAEGQRFAAFLRPIDEYAIVVAKGAVIVRYTAKSQSVRAMGKKEFAESKEKVLAWISALIGVAPEQLAQAEAA